MASLEGKKKKKIKTPTDFKSFSVFKKSKEGKKERKSCFKSKQVTVVGQRGVGKEFKYLIVIPINRKHIIILISRNTLSNMKKACC